jgi:CHAD domain-containing protein
MAKPRRVKGINADKGIARNARRILAVRIDEVYRYESAIGDARNVRELHDMRIAFKRLRYLLEIFDIGFREDLGPYTDQVKEMQDLLGDIHDCDVQVPMLQEHLDWLDRQEASALGALVANGGAPNGQASARDVEQAYQEFRASLDATRRSDERTGIHALIARRRHERTALYDRFLDEWRQLKRERFRQRLEVALGL